MWPEVAALAAWGAALVVAVMVTAWIVHLRQNNAGIVDVAWSANLAFLAILYGAIGSGLSERRVLVALMGGIAGFRLAVHIHRRAHGKPEDGRYTTLRKEWGGHIALKFLFFFLFQGALDLFLGIPFLLAAVNPAPRIFPLEWAGVAIWLVAIVGETSADRALERFKADPQHRGKTCREGLWKYSRHPNYFFEWLVWIAYAVFALASPWGWIALLCPALMLYFLLRVTGIPATETQALKSRGQDYREYQRTTSAFVPWRPKPGHGEGGISLPGFGLIEKGLVPDAILRLAIRRLLAQRLRDEQAGDPAAVGRRTANFVRQMRESPIAIATADANAQHYEVPPPFFEIVLGRQLKYSGCLWGPDAATLDAAEDAMLALTGERARLADGQDVLELGCGWGSLTLWMAERYPHSRITAVSNSSDQRRFIEERARQRALGNVSVVTADMNSFHPGAPFDRVVSVEMFEHMRNWPLLLSRVAAWMRPDARLFLHVFSHREVAYPFDVRDASDWMAREFFTGGLMPSDGLLAHFQDALSIEEHWQVDGTHYQKTAEAWLANLDRRRNEALAILARTYGAARARERFWAWRLFFLACAECWGYRNGTEWIVSHYRLIKS